MRGAKTIGSTRRMQRIAEKDQSREISDAGGSHLRGNSPAHRLAANRQPIPARHHLLANSRDHRAIARLQPVIRIGNSAALFAVQKVEGDRIDAARRKSGGKLDDKGASLTRTGSGAEDQRDVGSAVRRGGIETRGHAAVRQDLDADLPGHRILGWLELGIGQRVYLAISSIYLAGAPL